MKTGLYIHVPFCTRRCVYCDFPIVVGRARRAGDYAVAVAAELDALARASEEPVLETVYFGGGTPSRTPDVVVGLLERVRRLFPVAREAEITVEANPEDASTDVLDRLARAGVNRLSVGVQTLDDARLRFLGRRHDAAGARAALGRARSRFASVGLDLISGLPGTDVASWQTDLERAVDLDPDHIATYGLTVEEQTPLHILIARGRAPAPDEDRAAEQLAFTAGFLGARGYEHYEISNFARPGHRSQHNLRYWRQEPCLAAGLAASGYRDGTRWTNPQDLRGYLARIAGLESSPVSRFPPGPVAETVETLGPAPALGEAILLGLRLLEGVDLAALSRRHGLAAESLFGEAIQAHVRDGLLERADNRLRLTRRGLGFANRVQMEFTFPPAAGRS